jgi:hypothetical protein
MVNIAVGLVYVALGFLGLLAIVLWAMAYQNSDPRYKLVMLTPLWVLMNEAMNEDGRRYRNAYLVVLVGAVLLFVLESALRS